MNCDTYRSSLIEWTINVSLELWIICSFELVHSSNIRTKINDVWVFHLNRNTYRSSLIEWTINVSLELWKILSFELVHLKNIRFVLSMNDVFYIWIAEYLSHLNQILHKTFESVCSWNIWIIWIIIRGTFRSFQIRCIMRDLSFEWWIIHWVY